jgi:class 3 adenylate cyclase/tetratricopeptide (TPR) repeat protein
LGVEPRTSDGGGGLTVTTYFTLLLVPMRYSILVEDVKMVRWDATSEPAPGPPRRSHRGLKCPRCQHDNRPQAKFCEECAAPLAQTCANCGTRLSPTAKFCPECAHPVARPPVAEPRFGSPQSYTPRHLAERIVSSKSVLEGERKQVTVLFADLKGSMELLADRDPEEARGILDPVLELMMDAVHRYEGTVNQVMGDGIMALFGAPLAHEDHAVRACYAALRMQELVTPYAKDARRAHGVTVQIRIGLNSGEVVVRAIGSDLHMDYTAVGQTTHLAARLEQLAVPGTALLSAETLRLAEGYIQVKALGPVNIKGLSTPVDVYELSGAGPARTRLQTALARGLTRFVGRDTEMEQLYRAQAHAEEGHGQVVTVVGEPGIGKSRLFWEFARSHRTQGWLVLEAASVSYGKTTPYLPLTDLLRIYFRVGAGDDIRAVRERVIGKLVALDRALEPDLIPLLSLLDVPVEDTQWSALEPRERRRRTLDACRRLLLRESRVQPLALVFEDLQWIDSETQAFLDLLVESLPAARMLLLANARPEYEHGWARKTYYRQISLDPLPADSAAALLDLLLGTDPSMAPLKRLLIGRTEGNPFFLEESVRTLVESGAIIGDRGGYRLTKPPAALHVPATVQAVLAARIDRLTTETKQLLQAAAVIGKEAPLPLLREIADTSDSDLGQNLAQLQAGEFLYETSLFPEPVYTFKHPLTREVAYSGLLHERRRALHARVVEALERLSPDRPGERVELLAHHAVLGEQWATAARYLYAAGERAVASARYGAAASFYSAAIDALERQGQGADQSLKLDAYLELWVTRIETGEGKDLPALAAQAEALAEALGDRGRLAQVRLRQGQVDRTWGTTVEGAIQIVTEAFELADPADVRTRSYALNLRGAFYRDLGRLHDALRSFDTGAALVTEQASSSQTPGLVLPIYVTIRALQAETLAALGQFDDGLETARDALRMATRIAHLPSVALANAMLGHVHVERGHVEMALPHLELGLAIGTENGFIHSTVASAVYLAHALVLLGRQEEGLQKLTQALEASRAAYPMLNLWTKYGTLSAAVFLRAGRLAEAHAEIARGLSLVTTRHAAGHRASLLCLHASLRLQSDPPDTADATVLADPIALLKEALALAREMQMRPLVAHCHLGLGKLYRGTGKRQEAQEHLTVAAGMYREMGMRFWLEQAEMETREVA